MLIKFVPPEILERFGGARKYADAVNASLTRVGELLREPESIRDLLLGEAVTLAANASCLPTGWVDAIWETRIEMRVRFVTTQ